MTAHSRREENKRKLSMIGHWFKKKKNAGWWILPYKLVKHFIIEYIIISKAQRKTYSEKQEDCDITEVEFNNSSLFLWVLSA